MRKLTIVAFVMLSAICRASNLSLQGQFTTDDGVQLFSVSVAAPATVDIRSYGYAGGTTSTGVTVPGGGFDTILTLFDASGVFIDDNDDGAAGPADPATGLVGDARLTETLAAGNYIAALTQYDNFSLNNLPDGFAETGNPNFTADPSFTTGGACPGNMFRDISGTAARCRTGNWTIDFLNVSSAAPIATPEPSALLLAAVGLGLLLAVRRRNLGKKASVVAIGLLATLVTLPLHAQSTPPPDFSNVADFLNGQRTLLKVQDMELVQSSGTTLGLSTYSITTSNSQQTVSSNAAWSGVYASGSAPLFTFSAHMFNQPNAVTIATMNNFNQLGCPQNCYGTANFGLQFWNLGGGVGAGQWQPLANGDNPTVTGGAVADFNSDGYDDLVLSFVDNNAGRLLMMSAQDPNPANFAKGPKTAVTGVDPLGAIAAGDFNGDGLQEIAGLSITPNGGLKLEIFTVNPNSFTTTLATSLTLVADNPSSPVNVYSMARGRFNSAGHDQLVVAFAAGGASSVEVIDFQVNSLTPVAAPPGSPAGTIPFNAGGYLQVKTGKFGLPNNSFDQIVYHSSNPNSIGRFFEVLTVDPIQLTVGGTAPIGYNSDSTPCAAGIEVGNFDHRQSDPTNPNQTEPDLNSEIAFMYCRPPPSGYGGYGYTMNIYTVNPATFNINNINNLPESAAPLSTAFETTNKAPISFVATDIQGRSLTLGEPTKITVKSASQPTAIVTSPPMHVDWVTDAHGNPPALLDVSFVWDGYSTTYQQMDSTDEVSNTSNTTSWSFGAQESTTTSVTIGDPDEGDGLKVSDTAKAAQDLKGSSTTSQGTYLASKYNYTVSTGIDDEVTYVDSDFYIWVYPVIACPASNTACSSGVPLTIQYSASNGNATVTTAAGGTLSWYQPPWEPGNILSYPATRPMAQLTGLGQLGVALPNLSLLATDTAFNTDTSTSSQETSWENNTTKTLSTGVNQNYSYDNNFSVSGQVGVEGVSVGGSLDIDVNGSLGFDSLTEHTTTIGASTGVIINKPGTFRDPTHYEYAVTPYIFGLQPPNGVVDSQQPTGDIQTSGFQSVLYTVSPNVTEGWWLNTYSQAPDIALNHPVRWSMGHGYYNTSQPTPPPLSCLDPGAGSELDCPILSAPTPTEPYYDNFHWMRGLFISNAKSPGQGPQLESVTVGDQLSLQARVYNYSLVPMASNTAWAAFYAAPWDATNAPDQAVLIDKVQLPVIPPFDPTSNNTNNTLNWLLTPPVIFDPSDPKYQSILTPTSSVMFYVVVWMQDAGGNLMTAEMPAHGFTTALATPSTNVPSLSAWIADEQNFSNNVGLFYQEISVIKPPLEAVLPSPLGAVQHPLGAVRHPRPPEAAIEIGKIDISAKRVNRSDRVLLSASLQPSGETSGVTVNFYDGEPDDGGKIFKVTRIPHLAGDASRTMRTAYRAETCGTHHLFAVVNKGKTIEVVRRAPPLQVTCTSRPAPRKRDFGFDRQ